MSTKAAPIVATEERSNPVSKAILYIVLIALTLVFLGPLFFILMNSFKGRLFISDNPFALPLGDYFAGIQNYVTGLEQTGFLAAAGWSFFITIGSLDRKSVV